MADAADQYPDAHGAHACSGLAENVPAPHGEHTTAPLGPVAEATVPAAHSRHAALDDEPGGDVKPAPHAVHVTPVLE